MTAWSPWTATDRDLVEKVQEKASRNTTGLVGKTYEERCKEVGLESLAKRGIRQYLLPTFNIFKGIDGIRSDKLLKKSHIQQAREWPAILGTSRRKPTEKK